MQVNLAKNCGFCGGVQRAFSIVEKEFKMSNAEGRVLILGSLVHNENVMELIKGWGIKMIKTLRPIKPGDVVIITAHGVGKDVMDKIVAKKCKLFDATCPRVAVIHKQVMDHYRRGFQVVIFGDRLHKEVKGINGWCNGQAVVVEKLGDTKRLIEKWEAQRSPKPALVVSQTTQNADQYQVICGLLRDGAEKTGRKFKSMDTICNATSSRQKEAKAMATDNDAVVVVGGKKSANTKRLWHIARSINPRTIWIEQLDEEAEKKVAKVARKANSVAIISGASTPQWDIQEVGEFLRSGNFG